MQSVFIYVVYADSQSASILKYEFLNFRYCMPNVNSKYILYNKYIFLLCNNRFLTGSVDRTVRLWDLRTDQCQQTFWGHEADVTSLAFHPCGNNFVTCSEDKTSRSLLNYYNILAASLNYSALQNLLQTAKKLYNTIHTPFLHF